MSSGLGALLVLLASAAPAGPQPPAAHGVNEPLDYGTLTHTIFIDSLRAGSHDESGHNDYYFHVVMYGLLNSAEERNLEFAKRKKVTDDLGTFGGLKIDSLAVWRPDEKAKDFKELKIVGNSIRELAAQTMTEFKVQEADVAVEVEISMMKKNKRFVFFGDDQTVATAVYYPISPTKFEIPVRTNQALTIADDKGTLVKLSVRYEKPTVAAKNTPPPLPGPSAQKAP